MLEFQGNSRKEKISSHILQGVLDISVGCKCGYYLIQYNMKRQRAYCYVEEKITKRMKKGQVNCFQKEFLSPN